MSVWHKRHYKQRDKQPGDDALIADDLLASLLPLTYLECLCDSSRAPSLHAARTRH